MGEVTGAPRRAARTPATHDHAYDGRPDQIQHVRAFLAGILDGCPVADNAVLIGDELATNAVRHSNSGKPGGRFSVHVELHEPDYLWIEVKDEGSPPWTPRSPDGEPWHGLNIVRQFAGHANWGVDGDIRGWVVWARLDLTSPQPSSEHAGNGVVLCPFVLI
ncbi:MAG TPA: ATP-binding protein [Candidatus Dormibacteraeota bacterium]